MSKKASTLKEIVEKVEETYRSYKGISKYNPHTILMTHQKAHSQELLNMLESATEQKDEEAIINILEQLHRESSVEELYLNEVLPLGKEFGFSRPLKVVISSSQTTDEGILHQLIGH